ncbi:ras guanine nucleotide exchange factor domain-containing protein [Halteromyces radiatus]|uniref:ras guanine nucleotide exchange factor domain-containing protein n=1 Tax=Halteromyces radiatus TaxID=101107 RepID=UPI00221F727B|nr:ras guanine nucleotide exchange factor domain-containing protein [Halteromyces radiatus]KAI8097536.1 ras guanine nucleotide exchange factor domain-containing protein [Halteromyces radiatus]
MIQSTLRVTSKDHLPSSNKGINNNNNNIMNRTSVSSFRNNNHHSRSTTTIHHPTNRHRPSTQTAQFVQGQQDYLPSTTLLGSDSITIKKKEPSLYFRRGTVIEVINRDSSSGWWHGQYDNIRGWFPSHFVGRVSHLDTRMGSDDAVQKELNAWKTTLLDQQKTRMPINGNPALTNKRNIVSPCNDSSTKGPSLLKHRYSTTSSIHRQSMTPSIASNGIRSNSRTSSLIQQNKTESHSATHTASSVRKSRVPLPSPPSSACSSIIIDSPKFSQSTTFHSSTPSSSSQPQSSSSSSVINKISLDWENRIDEVSKHMYDLVDACVSPNKSNLHTKIHQTTSSIRALLACVPSCSLLEANDDDNDMLSDQRKTVLQLLSKVVHKGSELQLTGFVDNTCFRVLVNQLWVEIVAFEEIIRTTFKSPASSSPSSHPSEPSFNSPAIFTSVNATPPSSPPRDPITPRSSTNELDRLVCGLLDHQSQIIDLINTHIPYSNDLLRKDDHTTAIRTAKDAVFNAITQLIQAIREEKGDSTTTSTSSTQVASDATSVNQTLLSKVQHELPKVTPIETSRSAITTDNSLLMPVSPVSPQSAKLPLPSSEQESSIRKECVTTTLMGNTATSSTLAISSQHPKDTTVVNKYSSISVNSIDAYSSNLSVPTGLTNTNNSIRLSHSFEQLERPSSTTSSNLLRKSSELFRSSRNSSQITNTSSISSIGGESALHPSSDATPTVSASTSQRKLPRVTTLSNLAMRYLTSSSSTSTSSMLSNRSSQQQQQQQQQQNAMPPPPSPAASLTTVDVNVPRVSISPPQMSTREIRLLNSKSTPTFDQIKTSTSQSLRNMSVVSLRNISRKPRRLSNQNRKSDSTMAPPTFSTTTTTTTTTTGTSTASTTGGSSSLADPPLRMRISSSLRLRRSTDGNDQREKAALEQKLREVEEEEERNKPWFLKKNQIKSETILNAEGHLVGASLRVLIDTITCHEDCPDPHFLRTFFYNFRLFTDSETLARMLINRFNLTQPVHPDTEEPLTTEEEELWESDVHVPVQLRVYNVIKDWFEAYYDPLQDKKAAQMLLSFAKTDMETAMPMPAKRMTELIELKLMSATDLDSQKAIDDSSYSLERQQTQDSNVMISAAVAAAPLPSNTTSTPIRNALRRALASHHHHSSSVSSHFIHPLQESHHLSSIAIHRMDPQEIANQLTLMESTLFCQIPPSELMAAQKKKSAPAIHVKAMVHQSTLLVYWVSNTILGESDAKIRVMVIKFWIKVADACLQLNNFNTLMTIRCALNSASIARLRRTWDSVMRSTKYKTMYNTIDCVADSDRNFAMYRKCLKNATAPGLPFLGIFLSDMVFVDEGNMDHRTSTTLSSNGNEQSNHCIIINFDKYMKMTQMLDQTITRFQQVPYYKIKEIKEIQRYLLECIEAGNDSNEELIYSRSLEIEPRIVDEVCG